MRAHWMTGTALGFFLIVQTVFASGLDSEKQALIEQMLSLTEVSKMTDGIMEIMLEQSKTEFEQVLQEEVWEEAGRPERQREPIMEERFEDYAARFRETYPEKINPVRTMKSIYFALYDMHFTKEELKTLVAFHQTPAGKKYLELIPLITEKSTDQASRVLQPKIEDLIHMLFQEQKAVVLGGES